MKKESVRKVCFSVISVLLILSFISFVLAQEKTPGQAVNDVKDKVSETFANWQTGEFSPVLAKYLFAILVFIIIHPVAGMLPFFTMEDGKGKKTFVKFLFSVIVAILATAYLAPEDIQLMLVSYSSMGMVLGGVVPLIFLIFFTIEARKKGETGGLLMSAILWIGFIGFTIYKAAAGYMSTDPNMKISGGGFFTYLIIIAASILFYLFQGRIMKWIYSTQELEKRNEVLRAVDNANLAMEADARRVRGIRDSFKNKD